MPTSDVKPSVLIIGAGPAGLTAAYTLGKAGVAATVLEQDPVYVGGISRTVTYKNFGFDIGGHRFFSKSAEIEALWDEILGDDFIQRPRKSRIYYNNKFFSYPLKPIETFLRLGPIESVLCVLSYMQSRAFPHVPAKNFQEWVTNQFGARLFRIFFKTYTEKVWGMDCKEISADWAAQRIKGLSLGVAIKNAFFPGKKKGSKTVKTLIDSFRYPRKGPGMMWQKAAEHVVRMGGRVTLDRSVTHLAYNAASKKWQVSAVDGAGNQSTFEADHVISTAPMRELVASLSPAPSPALKAAAEGLRYRDFLIVALIVKDVDCFDDNWIYVHDPSVKVGRIQNFKSWSPELVPDPALNCYGMEYFCFEGDGIWDSTDEALVERATQELCKLGLAKPEEILEGHVVRQKKAYPVYDDVYSQHVRTIRVGLEADYPNLHLVGRNGMHKYNNQDHAMMTAILAAQNILAGETRYNLWNVNQDAEYHEVVEDEDAFDKTTGRLVPRKADSAA
jgi:protoporphyrinogen oxidase